MESDEIISSILMRYKELCVKYPQSAPFVSNDEGTSFYMSQKRGDNETPVQIRISNHGTYLRTWVDRQNLQDSRKRLLDPAHCINISIVFIDEGEDLTYDCNGQKNCNNCTIEPCVPQTFDGQNLIGRPFKIYQYVYKSKFIASRYINGLTKAIIEARVSGEYKDPLMKLYRACCYKELTSNNNNNNIKENRNMNMSKIRLTEAQLHRVIKESVKKTLKEKTDIKLQEHVYKTLGGLEADIATVISNTDSSSNQAFGSPKDKLKEIYNTMAHIGNDELAEEAKNTFTKLLEVLSELQYIRIKLKTFNADDKYWGHNWEPSKGTVGLSNY